MMYPQPSNKGCFSPYADGFQSKAKQQRPASPPVIFIFIFIFVFTSPSLFQSNAFSFGSMTRFGGTPPRQMRGRSHCRRPWRVRGSPRSPAQGQGTGHWKMAQSRIVSAVPSTSSIDDFSQYCDAARGTLEAPLVCGRCTANSLDWTVINDGKQVAIPRGSQTRGGGWAVNDKACFLMQNLSI